MTSVPASTVFNVDDFGAVGDGSTDDSGAVNDALDFMIAQRGGELRFTPGKTYLFENQVTANLAIPSPTYNCALKIVGQGATIQTSGAISGLRITGSTLCFATVLEGVYVDHDGNSAATNGIELIGTTMTRLNNCVVIGGNGTQSGYACYHVANSDPSDDDTGSFWTVFDHCAVRNFDGSPPDYGFRLLGSANATKILNCTMNSNVDAILLSHEAGYHTIPNTVVVMGCDIGGTGAGIHVAGESSNYGAFGLTATHNRFEGADPSISLTGATIDPNVLPTFAFNVYISGGDYIYNPNGLLANVLDFYQSPGVVAPAALYPYDGMSIANGNSATQNLTLKVGGGDRGLAVCDYSGNFKIGVVRDPATSIDCGLQAGGAFTILNLPTSMPGTSGEFYVASGFIKTV